MMAEFHVFYLFATVLSVVCGLVGLAGGLTLLAGQRSGRKLAIVAAFLSLSELSLGIILGVYTLWVLPHHDVNRTLE
jgi:FtsH-binding integral membrane protein